MKTEANIKANATSTSYLVPMPPTPRGGLGEGGVFFFCAVPVGDAMKDSTKAIRFLQSLVIPEGPKAGRRLKLAPFQKQFVEGALNPATDIAVLSVGRGNAKSALSAGVALGALLGKWDRQPRRDIVIAARTRGQARIAWNFAATFCLGLPDEVQAELIFRRSPRLEIEYQGDGGSHVLRAVVRQARQPIWV